MTATTFDDSLRTFARLGPYRPFVVELVSGTTIEVDHPEALVFRDGLAVFVGRGGVPYLFDHQGVAGFRGSQATSDAG